jgi:hypothetical protein
MHKFFKLLSKKDKKYYLKRQMLDSNNDTPRNKLYITNPQYKKDSISNNNKNINSLTTLNELQTISKFYHDIEENVKRTEVINNNDDSYNKDNDYDSGISSDLSASNSFIEEKKKMFMNKLDSKFNFYKSANNTNKRFYITDNTLSASSRKKNFKNPEQKNSNLLNNNINNIHNSNNNFKTSTISMINNTSFNKLIIQDRTLIKNKINSNRTNQNFNSPISSYRNTNTSTQINFYSSYGKAKENEKARSKMSKIEEIVKNIKIFENRREKVLKNLINNNYSK